MSDRDREWLERLARRVAHEIQRRPGGAPVEVNEPKSLKAENGYTRGNLVTVAKAGTDHLDVWLDEYPNVGRKVFSVSYSVESRNRRLVRLIADEGSKLPGLGKPVVTYRDGMTEAVERGSDVKRMKKRMPDEYFGKPVVELYKENEFSFYSVYFSQKVNTSERVVPRALVRRAVLFLLAMACCAEAAEQHKARSESVDYPAFKNRKSVRRHVSWERSSRQALMAKARDKYTCRVCGINFSRLYGSKLGDRFAEAHHKVPLSSRWSPRETQFGDLATVCSNCHSMLHRMKGERNDVASLRKQFTRKWPSKTPRGATP